MNPSPQANVNYNPAQPGEYRVPDRAPLSECRSCHAPILWTRTSKNGRPIPLSVATIRTDDQGVKWALNHFSDCPDAAAHRRPAEKKPRTIRLELVDLPAYLRANYLVVVASKISDDGNGHLNIELTTQHTQGEIR